MPSLAEELGEAAEHRGVNRFGQPAIAEDAARFEPPAELGGRGEPALL